MTAAVKEKSKSCLLIRREIDNCGLDPCELCVYAQITRRAANEEAWESLANMVSACRMALSQARKTLQLLNLAGITQ